MPFSNKSKYRVLCEQKSIPLFMQAWWMDAACVGKDWDVLFSEKEGQILGTFVFHYTSKFGFKLILQPQLTQYNGVWIDYPSSMKEEEKEVYATSIMNDLIDQIEKRKLHYFNQNFHKSITNCTSFQQKGFTQETRFTYIIEDIADIDKVYAGFTKGKKSYVRKTHNVLHVDYDLSPEAFYDYRVFTLQQRGKNILYSKELFLSIYNATIKKGQGQLIRISDKMGNIHSASFVVWDAQSAYFLVSGTNKDFRTSGASILKVWESIKFLSNKTKSFDFEGSMIVNVAKFNKEFGSVKTPYSNFSKNYSSLLRFLMKLHK